MIVCACERPVESARQLRVDHTGFSRDRRQQTRAEELVVVVTARCHAVRPVQFVVACRQQRRRRRHDVFCAGVDFAIVVRAVSRCLTPAARRKGRERKGGGRGGGEKKKEKREEEKEEGGEEKGEEN